MNDVLELAKKPADDEGRPVAEPARIEEEIEPEEAKSPPKDNIVSRGLSEERRLDLHASAITDQAIAEAGVYDDPDGKGWRLPWSDRQPFTHQGKERRGYDIPVRDRDKRRKGKDGDPVKVEWPYGMTLIPNILRHKTENTQGLVIEGARQQLAGLSYVPEGFNVVGMNGADGIHKGVTDRLGWAKGRTEYLIVDADHSSNGRVRGAVQRVAGHLRRAGAVFVRLVDLNGHKQADNDGLDDVLARLPEHERGPVLAELLDQAQEVAQEVVKTNDAFTDARMAERIADEVLAGRFCWVTGLGWLAWDGRRWTDASDVTVGEAVRAWSVVRFEETAELLTKGKASKDDVRGWMAMLNAGKERSVTSLARGLVERHIDELDGHPDLLNVQNGVVDLRTGELRPHDPALMMRKLAGAEYHPGTTRPDWAKILDALPPEVAAWYQERAGQAATGYMTPDDRLLVNQGAGENGKTTMIDTIGRALGDYFLLASDRILLANPDHHPTELMDLQGVRLAVAEETPEARRLAVARLKKTIGTPRINARRIRQDPVTFEATHTFILSTNYRPIVEETDHGTWRRLALVRFPYRFRKPGQELSGPADRVGDPTLRDRARLDPGVLAAALAWIVAGAVRWYANGRILSPLPEAVEAATLDWRKESDQVLAYLDERIRFDRKRHVMATELLDDVNDWLATRGHRPWSDKTLAARFGDHELIAGHHVEKRKTRKSSALSRTGNIDEHGRGLFADLDREPAPATYWAWHGVRFATDQDLAHDFATNTVGGKAP